VSVIPEYVVGSDLPDLAITWRDSAGALIDYSSGYTFSLRVGHAGSAASLTKSAGISGAASAPNVTVAWATTGELNTLPIGAYDAQLVATRVSDSKQRIFGFGLRMRPAIS
jgi:hypothetical protein